MTGTAHLVAFLWHQRSASIDTRERVLAELGTVAGALSLATCHRIEVYAAVPSGDEAWTWARRELGVTPPLEAGMTVVDGRVAARHLFRVAAGLDSVVAGEQQILGQVRRAYRDARSPHPLVARLAERALHVGRVVRREAGIERPRSIGSLAVDAALTDAPRGSRVLVVGAGEMGRLAVRALSRRAAVIVANRDGARAAALAHEFGVRSIELTHVASVLGEVDAVVSAADTRGAILTREALAARTRRGPLVVVDIAVPRSVAPDARDLPGLLYRSVDDLVVSGPTLDPARLARAEDRCAAEADAFERGAGAVETIVAMRAEAERLRREKMARALRRLAHLSERDRRVVELLSTTLTGALLHSPTVALREERADPAAARVLFGRKAPS